MATAGVAAADINLSGTAEMGIRGGTGYGLSEDLSTILANNDDARFHSSYTLSFAMTSETDNGLSFGATVRYDMDGNPDQENQNPVMDNGTIFISGSFGRLTLGDTDGALDWALTEVGMGGAIADDHTSHGGYNGNGGLDGSHDDQVLRYEYTMGDFGVAVSLEQANDGQGGNQRDDIMAIGARYSAGFGAGTVSFGIGYQAGDLYIDNNEGTVFSATTLRSAYTDNARVNAEYVGADGWGLSAGYAAGAYEVRMSAGRVSFDANNRAGTSFNIDEITHVGVGASYTMDALTLAANYGQYDVDVRNAADTDTSGWGLAANYDLGGGAVVQLGYGSTDAQAGLADSETWSFGVAMSF